MKKSFLVKSFILLLIITMLSFTIMSFTVQAADNASLQTDRINIGGETVDEIITENSDTETGPILQYDATTGETTEINMDEVRQNILQKNSRTGERLDRIEPFDPLGSQQNKASITPYSTTFNKVSNTSDFPYRVTCRISMEIYGKYGSASGFLVGPNILLTAAHCVMNKNDNDNTFAQWTAYPAYNNGAYKGIKTGWAKIIYPSGWKQNHSTENDWCICILNDNIGSQVGWYGCQAYGTNGEMDGLYVRAIGYPSNPGGSLYQYYTYGNLSWIKNGSFDTSSKIVEGMSGGPIARTSDNYAVGLVKGYFTFRPDTGIGVRITQQIIDLIRENS